MAKSKVAPPSGFAFSPPKNQVGLGSFRKFKLGRDEQKQDLRFTKLVKPNGPRLF